MKRRHAFLQAGFGSKIFGLSLVILGLLLILPILTYGYFSSDINNRERLMNRNSTGLSIYDRNGEMIYTQGNMHNEKDAKLSEISDYVEKGLIASEDKGFYKHGGFSPKNIAGAVYGNILSRNATQYGGSTITQQLIKNTLLKSNKSMFRKFQELFLSIAADRHYSKNDILEMYLNSVYFGEGSFGISEASKKYFNKTPDQLNLAESSMLIGLLPAPTRDSPLTGDPASAKKQQERVLNKMTEEGYINGDEKIAAMNQQLTYSSAPGFTNTHAQHYIQMVLEDLNNRFGEDAAARSGFRVTTSLDMDLQKKAEEQVKNRINELSAQGGTNAGLVAIDPKTGEIRALVGSVDWNNPTFGKVNVALSPRQPGSSFKPIYFSEAFDKHLITPSTVLHDDPQSFGGWRPQNHDLQFMGSIPVRRALALSRNITAIEVMQKLGVDQAAQAAQRMGVKTVNEPQKYGLTMALGTAETRLLDMTNAYATFANDGEQFAPKSVVTIKDRYDHVIYKANEPPKRVQSAEASFLVSSILADPDARAPTFNSLTIPGRPVAVKTGTTDENRNAWTIGYSPNMAVGVWVGNNENRPMSGVAGGAGAGPIWRGTIEHAFKNLPAEAFTQPSTVQKISCNGTEDYFINGTAPAGCTPPVAQAPPKPAEPPREERPKPEPRPARPETPQGDGGRGSGGDQPSTPPPPAPAPSSPPPPPPPAPPTPPPTDTQPTPPPPPDDDVPPQPPTNN